MYRVNMLGVPVGSGLLHFGAVKSASLIDHDNIQCHEGQRVHWNATISFVTALFHPN